MHYFESPFISRVKFVSESPDQIVIKGHYRIGDGATVPGYGAGLAICLFMTYVYIDSSVIVPILGGMLLLASLMMMAYTKVIVFKLNYRVVDVVTRTAFGSRSFSWSFKDLRLKTEQVAIRLADDCGAIDLELPDCKIRLEVLGRYDKAVAKAEALSARTGIALV